MLTDLLIMVHVFSIIVLLIFSFLGIFGQVFHHFSIFKQNDKSIQLAFLKYAFWSGLYFGWLLTFIFYLWAISLVTGLLFAPIALLIWKFVEKYILLKIRFKNPLIHETAK